MFLFTSLIFSHILSAPSLACQKGALAQRSEKTSLGRSDLLIRDFLTITNSTLPLTITDDSSRWYSKKIITTHVSLNQVIAAKCFVVKAFVFHWRRPFLRSLYFYGKISTNHTFSFRVLTPQQGIANPDQITRSRLLAIQVATAAAATTLWRRRFSMLTQCN
jgi:hypothetical protein